MNHPYRDNYIKCKIAPKAKFFHKVRAWFNKTFVKIDLKNKGYCVVCRSFKLQDKAFDGETDYDLHVRVLGKLRGCTCKKIKECQFNNCIFCKIAKLNNESSI